MGEITVDFCIEIEEPGWPPISVEGLKSAFIHPNRARIDNTPFFAKSVSLGDIVSVIAKENNTKFDFVEVVEISGNSSISIILRDDYRKDEIISSLSRLECFIEYGLFGETRMLAVSIPKSIDYRSIRECLIGLEKEDKISFAELCLEHRSY